jgi:hypothetical protein
MSIISRYVRWTGHDAGGTLPPANVVAGVLSATERIRFGFDGTSAQHAEVVYVPPQWMGDWDDGHRLAPGYQHVWLAPRDALRPITEPLGHPYRPVELPPAATGTRPRFRRAMRPSRNATTRTG